MFLKDLLVIASNETQQDKISAKDLLVVLITYCF